MSEVLEAGKFCLTHHKECGILHSSDCVFEAVPVKQERTFTKEDVKKVSDILKQSTDREKRYRNGECLALYILNTLGKVK